MESGPTRILDVMTTFLPRPIGRCYDHQDVNCECRSKDRTCYEYLRIKTRLLSFSLREIVSQGRSYGLKHAEINPRTKLFFAHQRAAPIQFVRFPFLEV